MGSSLLTPVSFEHSSCCRNGGHEGSDEGHEGKEGDEEGLCPLGQAPRLLRQGVQDPRWPQQVELDQEQERQDREQEGQRSCQEEPLGQGLPSCAQGARDQGLRPLQEGLPALQEGEGALPQVSVQSVAALALLVTGVATVDWAGFRGNAWAVTCM